MCGVEIMRSKRSVGIENMPKNAHGNKNHATAGDFHAQCICA